MVIKRLRSIILSFVSAVALSLFLAAPCVFASAMIPSQKDTAVKEDGAARQKLYADLKLTKEQEALLAQNRSKRKEETSALFTQMRENMATMRQALEADTLDMQKIQQVNGKLKEIQAKVIDSRLEGILEVRKILTSEQFKKFLTRRDERANRFRNK